MRSKPSHMSLIWLVLGVFLLLPVFGCGNSSDGGPEGRNGLPENLQAPPITSSDDAFGSGGVQPASALHDPRAGAEEDHDRPSPPVGFGAIATPTSPTTGETGVDAIVREWVDSPDAGPTHPNPMAASPMCGGPDDPCEERNVSAFVLFGTREGASAYSVQEETASVEDVLTRGLRLMGASPVHIALKGAAQSSSIRCDLRGIARTADQRETAIRFWLELADDDPLPSALEVERRFVEQLDSMNVAYPELQV